MLFDFVMLIFAFINLYIGGYLFHYIVKYEFKRAYILAGIFSIAAGLFSLFVLFPKYETIALYFLDKSN